MLAPLQVRSGASPLEGVADAHPILAGRAVVLDAAGCHEGSFNSLRRHIGLVEEVGHIGFDSEARSVRRSKPDAGIDKITAFDQVGWHNVEE